MKKTILLLILSIPLLQGCVPTMLAGAAAVGLVVYDNRSSKTILNDHNISYKAQNIINHDELLKNHSNIYVTSFNYTILLTGEVENDLLKKRAENLIKNIKGIKQIHNQVTIGPKISTAALSNDALITTKVKTELLKENGLETTQIKVITQNSTVYLMGLISKKDGDLAAEITRNINGVNKVVKVFEYVQ